VTARPLARGFFQQSVNALLTSLVEFFLLAAPMAPRCPFPFILAATRRCRACFDQLREIVPKVPRCGLSSFGSRKRIVVAHMVGSPEFDMFSASPSLRM